MTAFHTAGRNSGTQESYPAGIQDGFLDSRITGRPSALPVCGPEGWQKGKADGTDDGKPDRRKCTKTAEGRAGMKTMFRAERQAGIQRKQKLKNRIEMETRNRTKFIAFSSQKGGVGKSTFTTVTASLLHYQMGYNVAVFDCDYPQHSICQMRERDL